MVPYNCLFKIGNKLLKKANLHNFCIISNYFWQIIIFNLKHKFSEKCFASFPVLKLRLWQSIASDRKNKKVKCSQGLWTIRIKGFEGFFMTEFTKAIRFEKAQFHPFCFRQSKIIQIFSDPRSLLLQQGQRSWKIAQESVQKIS